MEKKCDNILKLNALRCKFRFAVKNSDFAGKTPKHFGKIRFCGMKRYNILKLNV